MTNLDLPVNYGPPVNGIIVSIVSYTSITEYYIIDGMFIVFALPGYSERACYYLYYYCLLCVNVYEYLALYTSHAL